eukprot:scaffold12163_cov111-Isochrysis_galbana.AAC.1
MDGGKDATLDALSVCELTLQTDSSSRQPADRGTPRSHPPHPPPHHKELEMAAWLPIYSSVSELPATICDLLPSTAAIEQQRRTRRQPSRQILFLLFAPKGRGHWGIYTWAWPAGRAHSHWRSPGGESARAEAEGTASKRAGGPQSTGANARPRRSLGHSRSALPCGRAGLGAGGGSEGARLQVRGWPRRWAPRQRATRRYQTGRPVVGEPRWRGGAPRRTSPPPPPRPAPPRRPAARSAPPPARGSAAAAGSAGAGPHGAPPAQSAAATWRASARAP